MTNDKHTDAFDNRRPLAGTTVGISISDSSDLARLGFLPIHVDRAMAEIAIQAAAAGARIGYGGDLRPNGFTHKLFRAVSELYSVHTIATDTPPCIHYLAYPIWKDWHSDRLFDHVRALDGTVEVVLIRPDGQAFSLRLLAAPGEESIPVVQIAVRPAKSHDGPTLDHGALHRTVENWWSQQGLPPLPRKDQVKSDGAAVPHALRKGTYLVRSASQMVDFLKYVQESTEIEPANAFSAMRLFMAADEDIRVVLGGKTHNYLGHFPGIAEETLYSLAAGKPVIELGGFGGCAGDVAHALLRGTEPERDLTGQGYTAVMRAAAAGSEVFCRALDAAGLADIYARLSAVDSPRALGIGVLRCLKHRDLRQIWCTYAQDFRDAALLSHL